MNDVMLHGNFVSGVSMETSLCLQRMRLRWAVGLVSDVNISGHTGSYPSGLGWAGGLPLTSVTAAPTARALTSLKYAKIRPEIRPGLHVKFARWF